jgi:hypothetical protein
MIIRNDGSTPSALFLSSFYCGRMRPAQRRQQWTIRWNWLTTPIPFKQVVRSAGEHSTDFSAFPFQPWNQHAVVPSRLVSHPGNDRSFGPLLDWDALRSGDSAAPNRRGVIRHGFGQPVGEISVHWVKGEGRQDRSQEIFDVFSLVLIPASEICFLLPCELFRRSLGFEVATNLVNRRRRCPDPH